jgi:hypothetical protein
MNALLPLGSPVRFLDDKRGPNYGILAEHTRHRTPSARVHGCNGNTYLVPLVNLTLESDREKCTFNHPEWVKIGGYGLVQMITGGFDSPRRPSIQLIVGFCFPRIVTVSFDSVIITGLMAASDMQPISNPTLAADPALVGWETHHAPDCGREQARDGSFVPLPLLYKGVLVGKLHQTDECSPMIPHIKDPELSRIFQENCSDWYAKYGNSEIQVQDTVAFWFKWHHEARFFGISQEQFIKTFQAYREQISICRQRRLLMKQKKN